MNKESIKKTAKRILAHLPLRDIILFESCPDCSDNPKPVFDEMVRREVNSKHKTIWLCYDNTYKSFPQIKNVRYVNANNKILTILLISTAKYTVCCNRFIGCANPKQLTFYLMHGSPIKDVSDHYYITDYIDYIITAGPYMNLQSARYLKADVNKCYPLGYPRNDALLTADLDLSQYFGHFNKYIVWYPTVKQQHNGKDYGIAPIPFMDDAQAVETLNDCANALNTLIIIKPHFAQIKNYKKFSLSNIRFIDDGFFCDNNIASYEFIGSCDALLTDYSSVFYDYMVCDKPIGLIWCDVEDMKRNIGLVDFYREVTDCCSKIYDINDLKNFLTEVADNTDTYLDNRQQVCNLVNAPRDGLNTIRVTDFIIEKANL